MTDADIPQYEQRLTIMWHDGTPQTDTGFTREAKGFNVSGVSSIMARLHDIAAVTIVPSDEQFSVRVTGPRTLTFEPSAGR